MLENPFVTSKMLDNEAQETGANSLCLISVVNSVCGGSGNLTYAAPHGSHFEHTRVRFDSWVVEDKTRTIVVDVFNIETAEIKIYIYCKYSDISQPLIKADLRPLITYPQFSHIHSFVSEISHQTLVLYASNAGK